VLTLFSVPKAFHDAAGTIQRNALGSWSALPGVQVVVVGDDAGVAEAAASAGAVHLTGVLTNEHGTPRLDDVFARVDAIARHPLRCFLNADIILLDDFLPAVARTFAWRSSFLMVGETIDMVVEEAVPLDRRDTRDELARRAHEEGRSRGPTAIDYFVFSAGLFDPVPPFAIGRSRFDNWLVWRGRSQGVVVDASAAVVAVHQHHDYGHLAGGHDEAHFGAEAARNLELAGGKRHVYTIHDASHRLSGDGRIRRKLGSVLRAQETLRKARWKLGA
jgi:hypothetical protein